MHCLADHPSGLRLFGRLFGCRRPGGFGAYCLQRKRSRTRPGAGGFCSTEASTAAATRTTIRHPVANGVGYPNPAGGSIPIVAPRTAHTDAVGERAFPFWLRCSGSDVNKQLGELHQALFGCCDACIKVSCSLKEFLFRSPNRGELLLERVVLRLAPSQFLQGGKIGRGFAESVDQGFITGEKGNLHERSDRVWRRQPVGPAATNINRGTPECDTISLLFFVT